MQYKNHIPPNCEDCLYFHISVHRIEIALSKISLNRIFNYSNSSHAYKVPSLKYLNGITKINQNEQA